MSKYRSIPKEIEAVEFNKKDLMPRDIGLKAEGPTGWMVWNELHQSWISFNVGDFIRIDLAPKDVYPIDRETFFSTYEPVETK